MYYNHARIIELESAGTLEIPRPFSIPLHYKKNFSQEIKMNRVFIHDG